MKLLEILLKNMNTYLLTKYHVRGWYSKDDFELKHSSNFSRIYSTFNELLAIQRFEEDTVEYCQVITIEVI